MTHVVSAEAAERRMRVAQHDERSLLLVTRKLSEDDWGPPGARYRLEAPLSRTIRVVTMSLHPRDQISTSPRYHSTCLYLHMLRVLHSAISTPKHATRVATQRVPTPSDPCRAALR